MTKEQINYLLVLATLLVVWLFFNTFYANAKKNYNQPPLGGVVSTSDNRFPPPPMAMSNMPQPPNIAEFLRNQPQGGQAPAAPGRMPNAPAPAPQRDRTPNS